MKSEFDVYALKLGQLAHRLAIEPQTPRLLRAPLQTAMAMAKAMANARQPAVRPDPTSEAAG